MEDYVERIHGQGSGRGEGITGTSMLCKSSSIVR